MGVESSSPHTTRHGTATGLTNLQNDGFELQNTMGFISRNDLYPLKSYSRLNFEINKFSNRPKTYDTPQYLELMELGIKIQRSIRIVQTNRISSETLKSEYYGQRYSHLKEM